MTKGVSRILVSSDTKTLCGERFDFEPFGFYKVKGRAKDVELFAPTEAVNISDLERPVNRERV